MRIVRKILSISLRKMLIPIGDSSIYDGEMQISERELGIFNRELRISPRELRIFLRELHISPGELPIFLRELHISPGELRIFLRELRISEREFEILGLFNKLCHKDTPLSVFTSALLFDQLFVRSEFHIEAPLFR